MASAAHVEYHARILAQKYLQRQLIHYAGDIETQAYDESVDVDELMQHAEGELFQLSQGNMKQDYTQIDPVIKDAVDILQRAAQNKGGLTLGSLATITSNWGISLSVSRVLSMRITLTRWLSRLRFLARMCSLC